MRYHWPDMLNGVIIGLICLMITISVVVTQLRLAITGEECKQEVKQPVEAL